MNQNELAKFISDDLNNVYQANVPMFSKELLKGLNDNMKTEEILPIMVLRAINLSAQLSTQYIITALTEAGVFDVQLDKLSSKPDLKLVWDSSKNPPQDN